MKTTESTKIDGDFAIRKLVPPPNTLPLGTGCDSMVTRRDAQNCRILSMTSEWFTPLFVIP